MSDVGAHPSPAQLDARHLAAVIESSEVAVFSFDLEGTYTVWSAAAERLYGFSEAEIVGRSVRELIPEDRAHELATIIHTISSGGTVRDFATRRRHKDGHLIDVVLSAAAVRDDQGSVVGAAGFVRDVSRLSEYEQRLRLYAEAIDASPIGLVIFGPKSSQDCRTVVRAANNLARILLNDTGLQEGMLASALRPNSPLIEAILSSLANGQTGDPSQVVVRVEGTERVFIVETVALAEGSVSVMLIDSTDTVAAEREREALRTRLTENEDVQRKRIAEGLHDGALQTLAGVNVELGSLRRGASDDVVVERVGRIESAIRTVAGDLRSLVFELFPADLEKEGLGSALERLASQSSTQSGPEVVVDVVLPNEVPLAIIRTAYRIMREGFANARQHAGASHITLQCVQSGESLLGAVVDDGVGLADGTHRSRPGHLGLRTMHERAVLVGGSVTFTPNEPIGTRLEFRLPISVGA